MIEPIDPQFLPSVSQSAGDQLVIEVDPDLGTDDYDSAYGDELYVRARTSRAVS
ncbi:MAG: hypothetical protein M1813_007671 [Trichoglossum hirsutum]|nr:MAG: hypothetical protein M1813_007671 [Trichoglossum hirsutum]